MKERRAEKVWKTLFEKFEEGDHVRIKLDTTWIYKGTWGRIVELIEADGIRYYLVKLDISSERIINERLHPNERERWVGYFRGDELELK